MKRIILPLFLIATTALVLLPFKPKVGDPIVFRQMSEKAIFNLNDPWQVQAILEQGFKVVSPHSDPQTIVRISGNHGPIAISKLTIESPGDVFVINNGGVIVGETANLDWGSLENQTKLLTTGNGKLRVDVDHPEQSAEVIHKGNVYALAINRERTIRATDSKPETERPTIFEFSKDESEILFSDE